MEGVMSHMCSIIVLGLLKLNIKAGHDVPEFWTTIFCRYHKSFVDTTKDLWFESIAMEIDWS